MSPRLALACDAAYLDTGAICRAATQIVLRAGGAPEAPEAGPVAAAAELESGPDPEVLAKGGHARRQADRGTEVAPRLTADVVERLAVRRGRRSAADEVVIEDRSRMP